MAGVLYLAVVEWSELKCDGGLSFWGQPLMLGI